jgi:hypothetical protein
VRPLEELKTVGGFAAQRSGTTHVGTDFVATGTTFEPPQSEVRAVNDGYVAQLKKQDCSCDSPTSVACNDPDASYSMILALDSGDKVAYRHIRFSDLMVPGLSGASVPNAERCWKDDGSQRFRVAQGQPLASTGPGTTPGAASHLHLEFAPALQTAQSLPTRANPICKMLALSTDPKRSLPLGDNAPGLIKTSLDDRTGLELLVLRKSANQVGFWLPALAQRKPPGTPFESGSDSELAKLDRQVADPSVAVIDDSWVDPASDTLLLTDGGKTALRRVAAGVTNVFFGASIPWVASGAVRTSLGSSVDVQVVEQSATVRRMRGSGQFMCFYLGGSGPFTGAMATADLQCPSTPGGPSPAGSSSLSVHTAPRPIAGTEHFFTLQSLTSGTCSLDPSLPSALGQPFNKFEGQATGLVDGQPGSLTFTITDGGGSNGVTDTIALSMQGVITCPTRNLDGGDGNFIASESAN